MTLRLILTDLLIYHGGNTGTPKSHASTAYFNGAAENITCAAKKEKVADKQRLFLTKDNLLSLAQHRLFNLRGDFSFNTLVSTMCFAGVTFYTWPGYTVTDSSNAR